MYPDAKYYGTPRHLRNNKAIPWEGETSASKAQWEPELSLEVTPGLDYENSPEDNSHHASVIAYHHLSKTIHAVDTLMYFDRPPWPLSWMGIKPKTVKKLSLMVL